MAQATYAACVAFVRKQEGGNADTPGDPGGRTGRGGITHATYDAYRDRTGLPRQDVFLISDAEIAEIYQENYWVPIYGDWLPAGQDLVLFDTAVNSGPAKANRLRVMAGDGDVPTLIKRICAARLSFLQSLGTWRQFGRTWGRRVADCEALALQMAGGLYLSTVEEASQAKDAQQKKAAAIVAAGAAAASTAPHFIGSGKAVVIVILGTAVVGTVIAIFNAWRQRQRSDALTSAVEQLQAAQAAAARAAASASAQFTAAERAVAAQQAELAKAKAIIDQAPAQAPLAPSPLPQKPFIPAAAPVAPAAPSPPPAAPAPPASPPPPLAAPAAAKPSPSK